MSRYTASPQGAISVTIGGLEPGAVYDLTPVEVTPAPPVALTVELTADKTGVLIHTAPANAVAVEFGYAATATTSAAGKTRVSLPQGAPYVPPAGLPWVRAAALDAKGAVIGQWTDPRIQTIPTVPVSTGFEPGLVSGANAADYGGAQILGAKRIRLEIALGSNNAEWLPAVCARYQAQGAIVHPLVGFAGRLPTVAEAAGLGALVEAIRKAGAIVKRIEFGNETSMGYQYSDGYQDQSYKDRARRYAECVKAAAEVLAPLGVEVLCQAEDGGSGSSVWVDEMFAAVPDLASHVGAWVGHFYSNARDAFQADTSGVPKLDRMIAQLAKHGDTGAIPIDCTEFGLTTDDGRTLNDGKHFTYAEAASYLPAAVGVLRTHAKGRLRFLGLYQVRDQAEHAASTDRERYFGALTHTLGGKGAYTAAVKSLLAS